MHGRVVEARVCLGLYEDRLFSAIETGHSDYRYGRALLVVLRVREHGLDLSLV